MSLVTIWSCLVGLAIILYVVLDGFSLGVALLFPTTRDERERDLLMDSIAPVWDANQTWIVFGGGALFVAFPMVYGVLFSALYIPLLTFIFGLIFRGVAFEFRANATRKKGWNRAFFFGSLVAVMAQGVTLGGIISGIKVTGGRFSGGPFDWLNLFSVTGRNCPGQRLSPSGLDLSDHQDHGSGSRSGLSTGLLGRRCGAGISGPGHFLDAPSLPFSPDLLVQPTQDILYLGFPGAGPYRLLRAHQRSEKPA